MGEMADLVIDLAIMHEDAFNGDTIIHDRSGYRNQQHDTKHLKGATVIAKRGNGVLLSVDGVRMMISKEHVEIDDYDDDDVYVFVDSRLHFRLMEQLKEYKRMRKSVEID